MMQRLPERAARIRARRRPRRLLAPSIEPLEPRGLMSSVNPLTGTTSLSDILFPTPPPKVPPLYPITIPSGLPKNVSGRVESLYQLSLTKHPLYQGNVLNHFIKAPMFKPGYTGPKRLNLDVIGADTRQSSARIAAQRESPGTHRSRTTGNLLLPDQPWRGKYQGLRSRTLGHLLRPPGLRHGWSRRTRGYRLVARCAEQQATSTVTLPASRVQVAGPSVQVWVPSSLLSSTASPGIRPANAHRLCVPGRGAGRPAERRCRLRAGSSPSRPARRGPRGVDFPDPGPPARRPASPAPGETAKLASASARGGRANPLARQRWQAASGTWSWGRRGTSTTARRPWSAP